MEIEVFKFNKYREKKVFKIFNINDYCKLEGHGSYGVTLYKKRGRGKRYSTPEMFDIAIQQCKEDLAATTFYNPKDENGLKLRDEKGKLLRIYTADEAKGCLEKILKMEIISFNDLDKIYEYVGYFKR
ncbi:MAG: hypothetical protein U9N59_06865 [Campylobacterota bacterium]|nr:hypothetical protein [Campylobacterota bacterium]